MKGFIEVTKVEGGAKMLLAVSTITRIEQVRWQNSSDTTTAIAVVDRNYTGGAAEFYVSEAFAEVARRIAESQ